MRTAAWVDGRPHAGGLRRHGRQEAGDWPQPPCWTSPRSRTSSGVHRDDAAGHRRVTHLKAGTTCTVAVLDGQTLRWFARGGQRALAGRVPGRAERDPGTPDRGTSPCGAPCSWRGGTRKKIGRHRKHQLLSCVIPGMDVSWDEGPGPARGCQVWLFGTTDGFPQGSLRGRAPGGGQDRLLDVLRDIVVGTLDNAIVAMIECSARTGDNATLAIWRVR